MIKGLLIGLSAVLMVTVIFNLAMLIPNNRHVGLEVIDGHKCIVSRDRINHIDALSCDWGR